MINIKHLSKLAGLTLKKKEEQVFLKQLEEVVSFVSQLNEVDTSNVSLEEDKNTITNVYSDDTIKQSLSSDEVLFNSDSRYNNFFKVGMVLKNKK